MSGATGYANAVPWLIVFIARVRLLHPRLFLRDYGSQAIEIRSSQAYAASREHANLCRLNVGHNRLGGKPSCLTGLT